MYFVVTEVYFEKELGCTNYTVWNHDSVNVVPLHFWREDTYLQLKQNTDIHVCCTSYSRTITRYMLLHAPDMCEA